VSNEQVDTPETGVVRIIIDVQTREGHDVKATRVINQAMLQAISEYAVYTILNGNEGGPKFVEKGASRHNHPEYDNQFRCEFCYVHQYGPHDNLEE
jgi:oxalate decarboxylase/phosphoglucose isomerase-like protein (cupin superfamily)